MTIGIYMLTFDGLEGWPYVGQSQNIEERYIAHKSPIKLGIEYPKIKSPAGDVFEIDNLSNFARIHNLNKSSLHQLLTGKRKSCSKWKLA